MPLYADIVLPLAQPAYTFAVPEGMHVEAGQAVAVQFGARKFYTGIVWRVHDRRPPFKTVKSIQRVLYGAPLLSAQQMAFWEWVAAYYMCTPGEVMRVGLPSLMKPSGDTEEEFTEEEFRPRTECYVALAPGLHDEGRLHEAFEKLERRAPRQYEALLELASAGDGERIPTGEVARRLLRADYAVLHALERKGYIVSAERERTVERGGSAFRLPELTPAQLAALESLRGQFARKPAALLHGITGSGKTEVYIHLIAEVLARGGDVLLLVPEIALTAQLIERMERIFGSRVTPYHSKLTNRRRTETYLRLNRSQGGEFVVGVRSSIFLPLKRLQLVVVDEEHDASYKQAFARDMGQCRKRKVRARLPDGAVRGCPAARNIRFGYDPRRQTRRTACAFQQVVARQDGSGARAGRAGDAVPEPPRVRALCRVFGVRVDGTLSALQRDAHLPQGRREARLPLLRLYGPRAGEMPVVVPRGFGTEKVEEEIARLFPAARVARLDRDSVTSERAFNAIIADFEARKTDILVGTQMITKGFDFGGVSLVGILNADNLLNNPDFRAAERAFQLMMQVAGRAGRRSDGGEVVIQTSEPGHPVIRQVAAGDYGMARAQLAEREAFFYPPYARLTLLTLRHRDVALLRRGITELAARLRGRFGRRVLGPMTPPVDRIRGEYLAGLLLKVESGASSARARELLGAELKAFSEDPEFRNITVVVNVDPQ